MSDIREAVIIGSGPAGYSAAIYLARANIRPLLFTGLYSGNKGGQLTTTTIVENYPGFSNGIDGNELMDEMYLQAKSVGSDFIEQDVVKVDFSVYPYKVFYGKKDSFVEAKSIIICTGAAARRLYVEGANSGEFWQKGVSACAVCDGALPMFRNKPIAVVGGGDSAMEEALFLAKYGSKIYILNRSKRYRASKIMLERAKANDKIEFVEDVELHKVRGEKVVTNIVVKSTITAEETTIDVAGVFFAIGHDPNTKFLDGQLKIDEDNYLITDETCRTSIEGVYAAGDVADKKYRQAIKAAGDGCVAALEAIHYLDVKSFQLV